MTDIIMFINQNHQNVILKFSLIISLVYNKDTDIEAPLPASVSHHCLVLSYNPQIVDVTTKVNTPS